MFYAIRSIYFIKRVDMARGNQVVDAFVTVPDKASIVEITGEAVINISTPAAIWAGCIS